MDANTIMQLIGSLGFPIVCCGALFWQQNKVMSEFSDRMEKKIDELSDSIKGNTKATTSLVSTVETIAKIGSDSNG